MILGKTIALGPILPVDIPQLFSWSDDPEAARANETYRPPSWAQQERFWLNTEGDATRMAFAIRSRSDAGIIGFVQLSAIEPVHRSATLGIRIGNAGERGKGFGSEALRLVLDYCWDDLNLSRVSLGVFAQNGRALALYERLGFQREGVARRALFIGGEWIDVVSMAILHPSRRAAEAGRGRTGAAPDVG